MKTAIWMRMFVALALAPAMVACTSTKAPGESTGQYMDDSAITTKVKAAILGEKGLKEFQISVTTYKGVVQLSGFVDTADAKAHATSVAAGVDGVKSVRNDLVVKK